MNKSEEINKFLQELASLYIQNPKLPIRNDTIYNKLMDYDFSKKELENRKTKPIFSKWIERFKEDKNINVFHADWQYRFLQVISNQHVNPRAIKLYLSFSKDNVYESVNRLVDYISSNNISVASKVADIIRSDFVVIRLNNKEDVMKIINFVNNDKELSGNLRKTNPFLLKQGNVGIAYDLLLSYNTVLSMLLEFYFKYCRLTNKLNEVSIGTFREYVYNFYSKVFSTKENIEMFLKNEEVSSSLENFSGDKVRAICNYEEIIRLICLTLNHNMNLEQYFSFYDKCVKEGNTKQNYNKYAEIMGEEKDNSYQKSVDLLNEYIRYAESKYGGSNVADYLERYISGVHRAITRDNNYRQNFVIYLSPKMVKFITNNNIRQYVNEHLNQKLKKQTSIEEYQLFLNACLETYKKYGSNHLYNAIEYGLNGDYGYFTNGKLGYRNQMTKVDVSENIDVYCQMIVKTYGNNMPLTDNLYENCVNAIGNMVIGQYNNQSISKTM